MLSSCSHPNATAVFAGADVVPRLGTSTSTGTNIVRNLSGSLLVGYSSGLAGVELGVGLNIERSFMCGWQIAGVGNIVAGPARGAQMSGGLNWAESLHGVQLGSIDIVRGPVYGVQAGGIDVARSVTGAQLGLLNIAGEMTGAQLGSLNIAGAMSGLQLGVVNVATGRVKGAQIGVVNYADTSAFSFGLFNFVRRGRLHVDVWGQESGLVMGGVVHGSDYFHNVYGVGVRVVGEETRVAFTLGIGGHLELSKVLSVDLDVLGYSLHDASGFEPTAFLAQGRALVALELGAHFGVFAGPSYTVVNAISAEEAQLAPYGGFPLDTYETNPVVGWPGVTAGVRAF
jgi:hypothetical protein